MKFDKNTVTIAIVGSLIVSLIVSLGVAALENQWEKESVEAELIVIDCHLEIKEKDKIDTSKVDWIISENDKILNVDYLETKVTIVNSVYSKYPLKIIHSEIDYSGGVTGEKSLILRHLSTGPIFPSETGEIVFYTPILVQGSCNLTAKLKIWYYEPSTNSIKLFDEDPFKVHFANGKLEKITPLQEYVTIKGYQIDDYSFRVHG